MNILVCKSFPAFLSILMKLTQAAEKASIVLTQLGKFTLFPGGSEFKASACNAGDLGSIPGSGRSPGERNGNPLQYFCLENSMDRGAWWAAVHRVAKSRTRSDLAHTHTRIGP